MVHADASNFADHVTKAEAYEQVILQAKALCDGQTNWVCNLANAASLLWHAYKSMPGASSQVNWAGFYVLDTSNISTRQQLILGPFQGKVACQTIAFGRGVCGKAAEARETQLVRDVEDFPDHIACDSESRSEIVVPVVADEGGSTGQRLVAIIDVDCAMVDGFDEEDRKYLEELAEILSARCTWPSAEGPENGSRWWWFR